MTTRILARLRKESNIAVRVMGFRGLSPLTAPDTFEKAILKKMGDVSDLLVDEVPKSLGGGTAFFSLIRAERVCLSCHEQDGIGEDEPMGAFVVYFGPKFLESLRVEEGLRP